MTDEWATCIECGWTGVADNNLTACPWCGYMISINIPEVSTRPYKVAGLHVGHVKLKRFVRNSRWKV